MEYPRFLRGNTSSKGRFSIAMLVYPSVMHKPLRSSKQVAKTVDGRNPANQLRLVVYPHYFQGFKNIPGGCLGCLPSAVLGKEYPLVN